MPKKVLPRIVSVAPDSERPWTLRLEWNNGEKNLVDVSGHLNAYNLYEPLRQSQGLFKQVKLGDLGTDVVWTDDIDMSADTLWRLAREQAGFTMTANDFKAWRVRRAYTLDTAAQALGIGRRMVAYYEQGEKPIPRLVALATQGLDAKPKSGELKKPLRNGKSGEFTAIRNPKSGEWSVKKPLARGGPRVTAAKRGDDKRKA